MQVADGGASLVPLGGVKRFVRQFLPLLKPASMVFGKNLCIELKTKLLEKDYWGLRPQVESAEKADKNTARFEQLQLQGAVVSLTLYKGPFDYLP
jgi:hypothetical protein